MLLDPLLGGLRQAVPLGAQTTPASVTKAIDRIKGANAWTLNQQVSFCEIPAPPFKEAPRGAEYKRRLEALGLTVRWSPSEVAAP